MKAYLTSLLSLIRRYASNFIYCWKERLIVNGGWFAAIALVLSLKAALIVFAVLCAITCVFVLWQAHILCDPEVQAMIAENNRYLEVNTDIEFRPVLMGMEDYRAMSAQAYDEIQHSWPLRHDAELGKYARAAIQDNIRVRRSCLRKLRELHAECDTLNSELVEMNFS